MKNNKKTFILMSLVILLFCVTFTACEIANTRNSSKPYTSIIKIEPYIDRTGTVLVPVWETSQQIGAEVILVPELNEIIINYNNNTTLINTANPTIEDKLFVYNGLSYITPNTKGKLLDIYVDWCDETEKVIFDTAKNYVELHNNKLIQQEPYTLIREIPILIYHEIKPPFPGSDRSLYVEPEVFAEQLDWLRDNKYQTLLLRDVYRHWYNGRPLPEKPVVITFDDGYLSNFTDALPLLQERGMKATFFIVPGTLGTRNHLTKDMLTSLVNSDMEIGSHTYNHVDLTSTSTEQLIVELGRSKSELKELTGQSVDFLSYPYGYYNSVVVAETKAYGYLGAVTVDFGKASIDQDIYKLMRIDINNYDGVAGMARKLSTR